MKIIQEKFFPSNPKWSEEYIHYLGSCIQNSNQYDLGVWIAPSGKDVSWLFVQSEEIGDYQSGPIIYNNIFNYQLLKNKYNDGNSLPVIETVIQAQVQKYLDKFSIRNLNFRSKYIFGLNISSFLVHPYKFKDITIYLKRNLTKLTGVIIIQADNHWNNNFFHKGKYYTYKDVLLIEDN